jgi:hypothetical protein
MPFVFFFYREKQRPTYTFAGISESPCRLFGAIYAVPPKSKGFAKVASVAKYRGEDYPKHAVVVILYYSAIAVFSIDLWDQRPGICQLFLEQSFQSLRKGTAHAMITSYNPKRKG